MEEFLNIINTSKRRLVESRLSFWEENKRNFKRNIKKLMALYPMPPGWKLYLVTSDFLFDKTIFPFDYDSWSSTNLIASTKKQGFEIMIFFNKARLEFLSLPALIPIVEHEFVHVKQAARNPKKYLKSLVNDRISKELEIEAEKSVRNISDEFRKQWVLESILYCYDLNGWSFAKKMADFLYNQMENMYGGGYDKGMTKSEYEVFLVSLQNRDISKFMEYFKEI